MNIRISSFVFCLLLFSLVEGKAQTSITDTVIQIRNVTVSAERRQRDNNIGSRRSDIQSVLLESSKTQTLGELLSENSLVYIKSLGQGGLSTSSFRGTSSSHTQVNWNGITINPIMGGSFDFSQFPNFFTDEVTLFHGNTYLKNGTGAFGGSINMNTRPDWNKETNRFRALLEYGANDTYTGGLAYRHVTSRLLSNTRLYYQQSDNDFKYLNKVLQKDPFYERRKEAKYWQGGLMQELYYKLGDSQQLSLAGWYMYNRNQLPQPILVNKKQHELQVTQNVRLNAGYQLVEEKHNFKANLAYLRDDLHYTQRFDGDYRGTDSDNKSNSLIVKTDYTYHFRENLELGGSLNYRYDWVHTNNYDDPIKRNTVTLTTNLVWRPKERTTLNLQLMGEQNDHLFMPTFSAGASYALIRDLLDVKGSVAYNYHYPTLNDLYWVPGGNPDLNPEKGFAYDATVSLNKTLGNFSFKLDASYYLMTVKDWIVWLPTQQTYLWSPKNIQKVFSHGAEIMGEVGLKTGVFSHRVIANYGYSPAINKTRSSDKDATVDKQLPYIPLHKWNLHYLLQVKDFSFKYGVAFTDKRYTSTDEEYSTVAFTIHDAEAGYMFHFPKSRYKAEFKLRVNNIFNAYYESTEFYPMPLRRFFGSMMFYF
ncbi:TonB-dependent receptor [Parabacteroides sp. AF18-52]|jgi:hypothetical protein|uniref:TonB-dependent receptor plug domain-containing protein n=1 Tax=Parabacteroides TaxID=375288 RepID=UPI000F00C71F|nr:TonB-dependent receptor [Parabacteroides sp. AF18-52]RHR40273.1 TonB-dependent receptor [Parabacteroides sp. AF18-52]